MSYPEIGGYSIWKGDNNMSRVQGSTKFGRLVLYCFKIAISSILVWGVVCGWFKTGLANDTSQQNYQLYLPHMANSVTEIDIPACRWPHAPGTYTNLNYRWGSNLQNPGTAWRNAFEAGTSDWNNTIIKFYFVYSGTGSVIFNTYSADDNRAGYTNIACDGSNTTGAQVFGNVFNDPGNNNARRAIAGHETGHSISIGHIVSNYIALMGNNPDPTIYFIPQPIDVALVNQIYP